MFLVLACLSILKSARTPMQENAVDGREAECGLKLSRRKQDATKFSEITFSGEKKL